MGNKNGERQRIGRGRRRTRRKGRKKRRDEYTYFTRRYRGEPCLKCPELVNCCRALGPHSLLSLTLYPFLLSPHFMLYRLHWPLQSPRLISDSLFSRELSAHLLFLQQKHGPSAAAAAALVFHKEPGVGLTMCLFLTQGCIRQT